MKEMQNDSSRSQHQEERSHEGRQGHSMHEHHQSDNALVSAATKRQNLINVNLQFDPAVPIAGKATKLTLTVAEQRSGEPITNFEKVHDKLMHLIIVNTSDLSSFAHVHPIISQEKGGKFELDHTFQEADEYKAWVDVKPQGESQVLAAFHFSVSGEPVHKPRIVGKDDGEEFSKVVDDGRYRIDLILPDHVAAGHTVNMTFRIADRDGKPILNLEPLMAAGGHCVIITSDAKEFLHVHPVKEVEQNWRGGPDVTFSATFPKNGAYRIWAQFQHNGTLITADYDLVIK